MFSKKMLPSKPKLVMPHTGESINRKVGLIRGQKNGSTDKITPELRQKLAPFSDKNYPPTRQKLTPNLARPVAPQRVSGALNI